MGKLFDLSFLILCAILSQEMVAAFDENTESSSVPHVRQKRMNRRTGSSSSSSNVLPPRFEDLKHVNMENPTLVEITTFENTTKPSYAIHPYFLLTRREYTIQGFSIFYNSGTVRRQPVKKCSGLYSGQLILIQLVNPVMMNNPVHRPFTAEHYPVEETDYAETLVNVWIRYHEPHFNPQPQQSLTEMRIFDPTKVVMTQNGERIGHGFAINPFIVVASRNFVREKVGVSSYTESRGEPKPHRIKNVLYHDNIGLVRLRNPVLLAVPVPGALDTEHFDISVITWTKKQARKWMNDILNG